MLPTSLKKHLETRPDDVQATIASLVEVPKHERGRFKIEHRATHVHHDNSVSRSDESIRKGKSTRLVTQPNTRNYEHCMRPTTHKAEACLFKKVAAKIRTDPSRSPEQCASDRSGSIVTVSTTAVVTSRHDQGPIETTIGTASTNTVAAAAKADGRSDTIRQHHLSKVTLAPQLLVCSSR